MIYVIGAGLAGLSAAVLLADKGLHVEIIEAASTAGGRCRSYEDPQLGMVIDNGNHLLLSGNNSAFRYVKTIGTEHNFVGPKEAEFAFYEVPTQKRWTVKPNDGHVPWWIFDRKRRVPDTVARNYLSFVPLARSGAHAAAELQRRNDVLWRRMLRPVLLATLNTDPEQAAPHLITSICSGHWAAAAVPAGHGLHPRRSPRLLSIRRCAFSGSMERLSASAAGFCDSPSKDGG